jgi:LuxR family transcriptional regulator, positive regulator of biofilm formation
MDKFSKLIVLTEHGSRHSLTILAQSAGIDVEQQSKIDFLFGGKVRAGTLLACPYSNVDLNKKAISGELQYLLQKTPLFLYQAERSLVEPMHALSAGIRGVIFRDEQPERVMNALKTMMAGELYYARPVMSALLDLLLTQDLARRTEPLLLPEETSLTKQETRIVQLVAQGARNKEIAGNLNISAHTVKAHLSAIFRKTQCRNRVELLRWAQQPSPPPSS